MLGDEFSSVLLGAQAGAEWAWTRLYQDLSPQLLGYLRSRGGNEPEDLLGDLWLQVARNIAGFSGDERDFRAWIFTVAYHRLVDERRYRGRRPSLPMAEVPVDAVTPEYAESHALESIAAEEIKHLLEQLTQQQRDVLTLRILAGMTIPEISKAMGKKVGAVKQLQRRAVRALVRLSEEEGIPLEALRSVTRVA
ncbi:MAG: RNA polymerase sigma factor [Acidimicrobiia bacterium]